jgi:hypothetical protein
MKAATNTPAFALAGEIVTTTAQARRILVDAIKANKEWLVPQAESVLRQLRAQGGAA